MAINLNANTNYQEQIKKLFFLYLKKKKSYDAYVYYHDKALNDNHLYYSVQNQICNGKNLLRDAFSWGGTTEGFNFWHKLAIEWERLIDQQYFHEHDFDFFKYIKEHINNIEK